MDYNKITLINNQYNNYSVSSKSDASFLKADAVKNAARSGRKEDIIQVSDRKTKTSFADELKACRDDIVNDLKKQASIDKKEQIKDEVLSGNYKIDASAIAQKIIINGFDFKI